LPFGEPIVGPDGELILPPEVFQKEPRTRPIGPITRYAGESRRQYVTVANRFQSGQVVLSPGESAEVPNTGALVKLLAIEGDNTVVLLEDGEEYTWVRGKVEWVLKPKKAETNEEEVVEGEESADEGFGSAG
jgi:hypothetical protein